MTKYRATSYDLSDQTYAVSLANAYKNESSTAQQQFNAFTGNLMKEPAINRYSLLSAIDEYQVSQQSHLSQYFVNFAYNYRPYQFL